MGYYMKGLHWEFVFRTPRLFKLCILVPMTSKDRGKRKRETGREKRKGERRGEKQRLVMEGFTVGLAGDEGTGEKREAGTTYIIARYLP